MIDLIIKKIRSLVEDWAKSDTETFIFTSSSIFTLAETHVASITGITKNGVAVSSDDYSWDSDTNQLTILTGSTQETLTANDIIIISYTYNKYSDTELKQYLTASLVWVSIVSNCERDWELETDGIYPTPSNRDCDLISIVASILINPSYSEYRLPNIVVKYPRTMSKEKRIQNLIKRYLFSTGFTDVLEWN